MAAFANNQGGYILFGVKDTPRELIGVEDAAFDNFPQEELTKRLNSLFAPEINWESGTVELSEIKIGYIYTREEGEKPVIALKQENTEKIKEGDVFYRNRGRSERIKHLQLVRIIDERVKREREQLLRLFDIIRNSDTASLGIMNYSNGVMSTPIGADILVDKSLLIEALRKANYIKEGSFHETEGRPVLKITGNIDLAEEVPVPDIEPDIQYPLRQKDMAEKLGITPHHLYALVWHFNMKGQKKFHLEITMSGNSKMHKFSVIALQYLADLLNKNKSNPDWLLDIVRQYNQR